MSTVGAYHRSPHRRISGDRRSTGEENIYAKAVLEDRYVLVAGGCVRINALCGYYEDR